jgi:F420-dependent oxidoreductase-like protein
VRFSFWIPNTISWAETLAAGAHAERVGYDGLWYADHFMPNAAEPADGPVHEAFTMLAALAAAVPRVRLGPLVAGNTYRNPAVAAKTAVTIDHISGGRFVLGLGAGWQENEHRAYGLQFETFRWRFDRLEVACHIVTSLLAGGRTSFAGKHYTLVEAPLDPGPVQSPLPILIGGGGEKRTLPIVARYAQEWNVWGTPEILAEKGAVLGTCLEAEGKDPRSVQRSAVALLFLSDDQATLDKLRSRDIGRPAMIGNPGELQEVIGAYRDAGVDEVVIPGFNLKPGAETEDVTARFITEVAAPFRG